MEVNGGNGGNGIHAQALGVGGQVPAVRRVIAGHMGDDGQLAAHLGHYMFQGFLPLGHALVDALAGGAAYVQALNAFIQQIFGQCPDGGSVHAAAFIIAGVKSGENALVFRKISHFITP